MFNTVGVTGVLRIVDIGLFSVRKCGNYTSFLRIADICCIFAECRYFCKINIKLKLILVVKNRRFDAHSVKILCNIYLKALKQTKTIHIEI